MKRVEREVLLLVALVLVVDLVFVAGYYLAVRRAPDREKLVFTACWTLATLAVVIRGLSRIRAERQRESKLPS
jgi:hypothetical protein